MFAAVSFQFIGDCFRIRVNRALVVVVFEEFLAFFKMSLSLDMLICGFIDKFGKWDRNFVQMLFN